MKNIAGVPYNEAEKLLKHLIKESECAILDCKNMKKLYPKQKALVHMYSIKMLHYEFMICRLKRHVNRSITPKLWCEDEKVQFQND